MPEDARLVVDPFGEQFGTPWLRFWARRALFETLLLTVQVRTRLIDEALVDFLRKGGAQVLLLGAGFDARAARFPDASTCFYEVDHPATQLHKRARMVERERVAYLPWDFEAEPIDRLPAALAALGHERSRPTLTIWEGVTMYLSEPAVAASVQAIAALSAPGSPVVFTYLDRASLQRPALARRIVAGLVAWGSEPLTFGFVPEELAGWLAALGLQLKHDVALPDAARLLLPERFHERFVDRSQRVAFAVRA